MVSEYGSEGGMEGSGGGFTGYFTLSNAHYLFDIQLDCVPIGPG